VSSVCTERVVFRTLERPLSHLVTQVGFPQFLLPPVNFDACTRSQPPSRSPQQKTDRRRLRERHQQRQRARCLLKARSIRVPIRARRRRSANRR